MLHLIPLASLFLKPTQRKGNLPGSRKTRRKRDHATHLLQRNDKHMWQTYLYNFHFAPEWPFYSIKTKVYIPNNINCSLVKYYCQSFSWKTYSRLWPILLYESFLLRISYPQNWTCWWNLTKTIESVSILRLDLVTLGQIESSEHFVKV